MSTAPSPQSISFEPLDPARHGALLHRWLTHPPSHFWQMTHASRCEVDAALEAVHQDPAQQGWIGAAEDVPVVYVETYEPSSLLPASVHRAERGDVGMHLLVAPPEGDPIPGYTDAVMSAVMDFCLQRGEGLGALRVVVEPDVRNSAILAKNAAAGFRVQREAEIEVDGHRKRAAISVCTREDFLASPLAPADAAPAPWAHLEAEHMSASHRHLVAKALAELSHERLIAPEADGEGGFVLDLSHGAPGSIGTERTVGVRYRFRAERLPLEHWVIEEPSITRWVDGEQAPLDVLELVLELREELSIPEDLEATYLEELSSTLASGAHKLARARAGERPRSAELVDADLQTIEAAMTEGHPGFLANNGRIGYALSDYERFAPELGRPVRLEWIAVRREHSRLSLSEGMQEEELLQSALSGTERRAVAARLADRGLELADVHLMPIHPWQADHRLPITFAADIARGDIIPLGRGGEEYQAQQSLRTFANRTRPQAPYVKTALAIQNMGFLRGLSPAYMVSTPAINDWVHALVASDDAFADSGFSVLRERAALGYTGDAYHRTAASNPQRKMLAALWREHPSALADPEEQLMSLAAVLHRDHEGVSLVGQIIEAAGIGAGAWVRELLQAYLVPAAHALLAHDLVFMPHGENLILRLREHRVTGAFMKDIGEEVAYLGPDALPEGIGRIAADVPEQEKALSIHTDVLDGVLRHLSGILHTDGLLRASAFWEIAAEVLEEHADAHPEISRGRGGGIDLRSSTFAHSCLNRLQLRDTRTMVDLGDQASSLLFAGNLVNPIAR